MPELSDPAGYPNDEWFTRRMKYWEWWDHFDGGFLDEQTGQRDKYPLKINVFNMACLLHAAFLFGEVRDSSTSMVDVIIEPWGQDASDSDRDMAKELTDLIERVWYENDGMARQQEAGIISQITGGCVFGTAFDHRMEEDGLLGIRIDHVMPEYVFPVWATTQYWELPEVIVCFEITQKQADLVYGVKTDDAVPLYQERWTRNEYEITISGKPVKWGKHVMSGTPLAGIVPYTYIPHIRAGEFYGISLLDGKGPLAREVNARWADLGDNSSEIASQLPAISNVRQPSIRRIGPGKSFVDLGNDVPGMSSPTIHYPSSVQTNTASVDYANDLLSLARSEAFTPPIVYGLDEGSQRSGMTLMLRMIPLISHIRQERALWQTGIRQVVRQILLIMAEKKIGPKGLTREKVNKLKIWCEWAPMLPREREAELNEIIMRLNSGLIDPETALNRLGDIRDIKTAMGLIKQWLEYQASLGQQGDNPFGGTGAMGEQQGLVKPKQPQPNLAKEE
jgi:hypothetical protein